MELKNLNAVDFDDLLLLTVKLLAEHEDVRERWQQRFRYVMVDEFQDTNRLQLELVSLLANPAVRTTAQARMWPWWAMTTNHLRLARRGGRRTFSNSKRIFPNPDGGEAGAELPHHERYSRHGERPDQKQSATPAETALERARGRRKGAGDRDADDRQEAEFIANEIAQRVSWRRRSTRNFAVLFRMNAQVAAAGENLRQLHIPYRLIGGKSFFDRREVKDLLAYANCP